MFKKTCPLCKKNLSLKQINFTTAVYICDDLKCKYPIGYDCVIVERKFEDMDKGIETLSGREEDLDDWISDVVSRENIVENETPASPIPNENTSTNPENWINTFIQETVNENNVLENMSSASELNMFEVNQMNSKSDTDAQIETLDDILDFVYNIN